MKRSVILFSLAFLFFIFSFDFVSGACNTKFGYCDGTLPQITKTIGISTTTIINNNTNITLYINTSESDPFFIQENASLWNEAKNKGNASYVPYLNANNNVDFNGKNLLNISNVMAIALYPLNYFVSGAKAYLGSYGPGYGYLGWGYNSGIGGWVLSPDNVPSYADLGISTTNGSCSGTLTLNCEDIGNQAICEGASGYCSWDGTCYRVDTPITCEGINPSDCTLAKTNNKCNTVEGLCLPVAGEPTCSDMIAEEVCGGAEQECEWATIGEITACYGEGLTSCNGITNNSISCSGFGCNYYPNTLRNGNFWGNITSEGFKDLNGNYYSYADLNKSSSGEPLFLAENVSIWNEAKNKANTTYAIKMDYNATSNLNMTNKNISGIDKLYNASGQEFTLTSLNSSGSYNYNQTLPANGYCNASFLERNASSNLNMSNSNITNIAYFKNASGELFDFNSLNKTALQNLSDVCMLNNTNTFRADQSMNGYNLTNIKSLTFGTTNNFNQFPIFGYFGPSNNPVGADILRFYHNFTDSTQRLVTAINNQGSQEWILRNTTGGQGGHIDYLSPGGAMGGIRIRNNTNQNNIYLMGLQGGGEYLGSCLGTCTPAQQFSVWPNNTITINSNMTMSAGSTFGWLPNTTGMLCSASTEGSTYYDGQSKKPFFCNSTNWRNMSVN